MLIRPPGIASPIWRRRVAPSSSYSYFVDNLIAAGATVRAAFSPSHLLKSDYGGALTRVRRGSDNLQENIGPDATTHRLDEAALAAHCAGTNGFHVTAYDQMGIYDFTQATALYQNKVYDAVTGVNKLGSLPTILGVSGAGMTRADTLGLAGSPAHTHIYQARHVASSARENVASLDPSSGSGFCVGLAPTNKPAFSKNGNYSGGRREFSEVNAVTDWCGYTAVWQASGTFSTCTMRQDGNDMAQFSVLSAGVVLSSNPSYLYGWVGGITNVQCGLYVLLDGVPTAPVQAVIDDFHAACKAEAGY